jgi:hypothetical protein
MKVRILTLALILSFLAISASVGDSVLAQRTTKNRHRVAGIARWHVFVSPDGDFTLSFPQKPDREPDAAGPVTVITSYGLYTQNGMRFSVNSQGSSGDPNSRLNNQWDDEYEKALLAKYREDNLRVVNTRRIGKNTFEAEIWDSSSDKSQTGQSINYIMRTILRQRRIYTLLCGSEIYGRLLNQPTCRRFFDSLSFIDINNRASSY